MDVVGKVSGETLYIFLIGELDEHSAPRARRLADEAIDANAGCARAVFDLSGVRFMDSTGIGFWSGGTSGCAATASPPRCSRSASRRTKCFR